VIVDLKLLEKQAAAINDVVCNLDLTVEQGDCLEGVWNFLHAILDHEKDGCVGLEFMHGHEEDR
jgi:hypothetical protein